MQSLLTELVAVYASLYSKLHYTHINSSLRANIVTLAAQVNGHKTANEETAAKHARQLADAQSAYNANIKKKEAEWKVAYQRRLDEKKAAWKETEQTATTRIRNLEDKVGALISEKKQVER